MNSRSIPAGSALDPSKLPRHVAIIMDGNGRWAKKRLFNRIQGHERGAETVRTVVRTSREIGIGVLTLYAFSTENWQRPRTEVIALMKLLERFLESERTELMENNIRLNAIGQTDRLPDSTRHVLEQIMALTQNNTALLLNLALSYGGRDEIVRMVQTIGGKIKSGEIDPSVVTPELVAANLYTRGMPDPDLLIRTSGEMRISNFLLWQIAYTELYVTETLWPDFTKEEFIRILEEYQQRDRRFGRI